MCIKTKYLRHQKVTREKFIEKSNVLNNKQNQFKRNTFIKFSNVL